MARQSKWNALLEIPVGETHAFADGVKYTNAQMAVYRLHCSTTARFSLSHSQGKLLVQRLPDADQHVGEPDRGIERIAEAHARIAGGHDRLAVTHLHCTVGDVEPACPDRV